ncbi:MAG: TIGR01777 family protein [Deltaproteobacteria bacterium]|nr:TIGR01777 family protein [Deltaproteobacteria bacterium]
MNVVITGATGLIGRALARSLLGAGHGVVAWTRNPESARRRLPALCEARRWDAERVEPADLDGVDVVVHLAGENVASGRWTAARRAAIEQSRVASTRAIVDAIAKRSVSDRPRAFVCASAIGIYGDRGDEILEEDDSPGEGFLAGVCKAWEREALAAAGLGVRAVAVRVGVVLAPEEGALGRLLPIFRLGLGGPVASGKQWMSWIHLDDVVALFRHAVESEGVRGPMNAVAPAPVRNHEFTRVLAQSLGRPALLPVPAFGLKLAFGEMASVLLASQRVRPRVAEETGFRHRYATLAEALAPICASPDHESVYEQVVPVPIEEAFAFFADAKNLERITPDFLHFSITGMSTEKIELGTTIDYRLRLHGMPVRWRSRIEEWAPPHRFVDVQLSGPYAVWHHTHELEEVDGGTLVRDRVRYRLPLGALGDLAAGSFVARDLERIFEHRYETLARLLHPRSGAAPASRPGPASIAD